MLRELRIRNFAVIESVAVEFRPGLNVLTGETGAGKSMLIDAILLVLGARAQTDVIRSDADAATVEAVFDVKPRGAVAATLDEAGLAPDDGVLVARRELSRSGRHRAFVNDAAVTVALLERLGDHLVEVHGQHEHQRLLEPARQLELLDRFADAEELRERVAGLVAKFREARAEAERTRAAERDRAQREDLLRFQLSELDAARLRPGEEEELRQERRRLQHADKLTAGLAEVAALLDDDHESATGRVSIPRWRRPSSRSTRLGRSSKTPSRRSERSASRCRSSPPAWRRSTSGSTRSRASSGNTAIPRRRCSSSATRSSPSSTGSRATRRSSRPRSGGSASSRPSSGRRPRRSPSGGGPRRSVWGPPWSGSCARSAWSAPTSGSGWNGRSSRGRRPGGSSGSSSGSRPIRARTCGRSRAWRLAASSRARCLG